MAETNIAIYKSDTSEAQSQPEKRPFPRLDVTKSYEIFNRIVADPSWLSNPRTRDAANAVFSEVSKTIGMNMQLERLNNQSEAARAENIIGRQVATSLLKLAETGRGAKIAAKWYAVGDDGSPLWKNSANWKSILDEYDELEAGTSKPMSMTLNDGTVVQGWADPKTGRFTQFVDKVGDAKELITARSEAQRGQIHQRLEGAKDLIGLRGEATREQIQQRFDNQLALIDPKNASDVEKLREKHKLAMEFFDYKTANAKSNPAVLEKEVEYLRNLQAEGADQSLISMVKKRIEFGKLSQGAGSVKVTTTTGDDKVERTMSQSEYESEKAKQPPDAATRQQLEEYATHKSNLDAGDKRTVFGGNRQQKLDELKLALRQKGWDADTGQRIGLPAASTSTNAPATNAPTNSRVTTKEQFDALTPGTIYTGKDGTQYEKP